MSENKLVRRPEVWKDRIRVEDARKSVAILIPALDHVHTEFAVSLAQMILHTAGNGAELLSHLSIQTYGCSIIPHARHVLAQHAVESGVTHTLWIDSDMQFPQDMLLRFARHDEKLIGINAMMRRPPYLNCAQAQPGMPLLITEESRGLEKVHRTGFGVMWVATEVFRSISMPWFDLVYQPQLHQFRGEDYVFCEKARAAGYEVYVDLDISREVKHLGSYGFNPWMKLETPTA